MSFAVLFTGWFLVAWAVSWPIAIAAHAAVRSPAGYGWTNYGWPRVGWSFVLALGATLISTSDLGWSP